MPDFVLPAPATPSLAVAGTSARFPLRRIFCVGRNYAEHAREMGHDPDREPPFFFTKPADAAFDAPEGGGAAIPYPPATQDLHFEIELSVAIGRGGAAIAEADAAAHVFGHAVGIDLTRRDLQAQAKTAGRPWDMAKGFDLSAPHGAVVPLADWNSPGTGAIWLDCDGARRQEADLADMIWPVAGIIAALSRLVTLAPGDLIMTGTPAGVGAVAAGSVLRGGVADLPGVELRIG
jgi:fumarylpyruvate hydrolase